MSWKRRRAAAQSWRARPMLLPGLVPLAGVVLAAGMALPVMAAPAPAGPATAAARRVLPSYVPMWATLVAAGGSATADLGPAAASAPVSARVYLAGRDPRGLAAYAAAVSDPRDRMFHRYLTPAHVQQRFGPAALQVTSVRSWLAGTGLRVTGATSHYVTVSGTAAQAQGAFGAVWDSFQVAGRTQQSPPPGAQVTAPPRIASAVLTMVPVEIGLPGSPSTPAPTAIGLTAPSPCSQYFGQDLASSLPDPYGQPAPYGVCGYAPQQLRSAYGVPAGLTGKGVTVAVVHEWAYPTAAQDLATFGTRHGEPLRPGQFTQILPPGLNASCLNGTQTASARATNEEDLDVEGVHEMAPDANIVYLGTKCDDDFGTLSVLDALTEITDHYLASIVSDSAGAPVTSPGLVAAYQQIFQQGAAEGIGFYTPSGDYGDNSIHAANHQPMPPTYPASDPWVTAVGGTTLAIGPNSNYEWETGWGDDAAVPTADGTAWADLPGTFTAGAGGGTSTLFAQPSYQRGVVAATLSHAGGSAAPMRVVPDIAADADPATGPVIGVTVSPAPGQPARYSEFPGDGTSISTPLIVGMQADAQQAAGLPFGFANPAIYARSGSPAYHDVTDHPLGADVTLDAVLPAGFGGSIQPLLETFGMDLGLAAAPGYDDVTGVGTPAPGYFASYRRR